MELKEDIKKKKSLEDLRNEIARLVIAETRKEERGEERNELLSGIVPEELGDDDLELFRLLDEDRLEKHHIQERDKVLLGQASKGDIRISSQQLLGWIRREWENKEVKK